MGKKPRRRRSFTPEFTAEIVERCQQGDRSVDQVAKDLDLTETAVREWVKQAERDSGDRQDGGLTSTEREKVAQLRRENRRLRENVEILQRATGLDDQRHVRGWICEQPDVLQRIAVQHDHICLSIGRRGPGLVLGAQPLRRHARCRGVPHPCPGAAAP